MLSAIETTSTLTYHKINDIISTKDSILNYVKSNDRKFRNPENTARNYLNTLCDMQVLEKKEIEGHHYYLNLELYRILSE